MAYLLQSAIIAVKCFLKIGEITCTSPDHSSLMYFGILRDIEWRMIMGMPLPPNETEVIDYINYCVDIFLKGHHKV